MHLKSGTKWCRGKSFSLSCSWVLHQPVAGRLVVFCWLTVSVFKLSDSLKRNFCIWWWHMPPNWLSSECFWAPDWKNPSIAPEALTDLLRQNFGAMTIALKKFSGYHSSSMENFHPPPPTLMRWTLFKNRNILLTIFRLLDNFFPLACELFWWFFDIFLPTFVILFTFLVCLAILLTFFGLVVPICAQPAAKLSARPSICSERALIFFWRNCPFVPNAHWRFWCKGRFVPNMLMKVCIFSSWVWAYIVL